MASLFINLFYSCQSFWRHTPAVLSPTAVIQVKMLTRGGVAVELRREKSFPRWGLARNIGWGCGGLKIPPHWLGWVFEKPPELYCIGMWFSQWLDADWSKPMSQCYPYVKMVLKQSASWFVGVQRYAKKRIVIWKTRIAIHIVIHLVSLFRSITAPRLA